MTMRPSLAVTMHGVRGAGAAAQALGLRVAVAAEGMPETPSGSTIPR